MWCSNINSRVSFSKWFPFRLRFEIDCRNFYCDNNDSIKQFNCPRSVNIDRIRKGQLKCNMLLPRHMIHSTLQTYKCVIVTFMFSRNESARAICLKAFFAYRLNKDLSFVHAFVTPAILAVINRLHRFAWSHSDRTPGSLKIS